MNRLIVLLTIYGTKALAVISTVVVASMLAYSGMVLYDTAYTNRAAYASWDLTQYRPVAYEEEEPSFEEVQEINKDSCAWLILPGTHIDYPIVQGKDDVEYSMKDIYGKSSLTGSIYLANVNKNDFTDSFNMVYGHHMDNGAMFGDIDKYVDPTFFNEHQNGYLVTTKGVFDIHVFARLSADAYDYRLYSAGDRGFEEFPDFLYYVKSLAVQWDDSLDIEKTTKNIKLYLKARDENIAENGRFVFNKMPEDAVKNGMQLIAMSTCADAETNGRQLLIATMKMRTEPIPKSIILDETTPLAIWGHGVTDHWSLLNLVCAVMTLAILLPGWRIRRKYRDFPVLLKDFRNRKNHQEESEKQMTPGQRKFIGILIQILIAVFSIFWFIWTEDPHNPMVMVDRWTLAMIVLFGITWYIDVYVIRHQNFSNKIIKNDIN